MAGSAAWAGRHDTNSAVHCAADSITKADSIKLQKKPVEMNWPKHDLNSDELVYETLASNHIDLLNHNIFPIISS